MLGVVDVKERNRNILYVVLRVQWQTEHSVGASVVVVTNFWDMWKFQTTLKTVTYKQICLALNTVSVDGVTIVLPLTIKLDLRPTIT